MTEQEQIQLSKEEREELQKTIETGDIREFGKVISILVRAFDGLDVSGDDKITMLTNPRNILERSRYPTYTQLSLVVYLELLYTQSNCIAYHEWATKLSEALISYKGQGRGEYVEMNKAQVFSQMFPITQPQISQPQSPQQKTHWYSRTPKPVEQQTQQKETAENIS